MSLTWTTLRDTLAAALVQAPSPYTSLPTDFETLYPESLQYAEGRIYGDLVMLAQRDVDTSITTVSGTRTFSIAGLANTMVVVEGVALLSGGIQYPYDKGSLDLIDHLWPQASATVAPSAATWVGRYHAMLDDHTIALCPTPDGTYTVQLTGLVQPTGLSAANPSTYLSTVYPELLTAGCMVWLVGALLRNFGAQADDPKQALSWEATYQVLKSNVEGEELRRRGLTDAVPGQKKG
jgi:hypothetical protein